MPVILYVGPSRSNTCQIVTYHSRYVGYSKFVQPQHCICGISGDCNHLATEHVSWGEILAMHCTCDIDQRKLHSKQCSALPAACRMHNGCMMVHPCGIISRAQLPACNNLVALPTKSTTSVSRNMPHLPAESFHILQTRWLLCQECIQLT